MSFTPGNDINILQGTDQGVVSAGAGNDRYVLDASTLTANQKITISDTLGANTLQLAGGLVIVSALVAANDIQLTLNNGAVITVLGASSFSFQTGGNVLNGTGGTVQAYSAFVTTSLGVAAGVPATGATPVAAGTVTVNQAGGTTAGGGVVVPPVNTFTLTSADSVNEGDANEFTVTASAPVTANTVVTFQLQAPATGTADAGTNNTNLNDFNAGAFNPVSVTILAGQTTAKYSVSTKANDGTELSETYTMTAMVAGQVAALTKTVTVLDGAVGAGQTFMLTTGVDNIIGSAGNDVINATNPAAPNSVLGGLDKVDGGDGIDTLNIADTATVATADFVLPAGFTVKNVEILNVTTNGAIGTGGTTNFDVSGFTGLTTFKGVAAGTGTGTGSQVKAAATTDVSLTVAGTDTSTVNGGKTVAITGGGVATVTDAAGATGTTLTSVSLTNVGSAGGVTSVVTGNGIASVTLAGAAAAANTVTVANATVGHALTVNAAGTGYTAATPAVKAATVVTDVAATSLTINTTAKSALDASGSTLVKNVTLTGAGALDLAPMGAATVAIDGSAATGALTLGTLLANAVTVKTGAGNDTFTLSATAKATVDAGAGNDSVTLGAILAAGSTVNLGAGNDKLLGTAKVAASTATQVTVIDAGDGVDTVSAGLINNGNAAQFKNFEVIGLEGATTLDLALMTGSTITGLELVSGGGTYTNATLAQSMMVNTNTTGTATSVVFNGATGAADAYAINFGATSTGTATSATPIDAGTLTLAGIEIFNVASGATAGVSANALTFTAAQAQQINITGSQALTVGFAGINGTIVSTVGGISSIDGSAATGKLAINVANVTAATAGITIKGGSAVDTLTTSTFATTLVGGAGNDSFVVTAAAAGAGLSATPVVTTISDFAKGDTITLASTAGATTFNATKVDVAAAVTLAAALDLAGGTGTTATNGTISWFQYGGNTYVVQDITNTATTALGATDVVVKLTGLLDLSTAATTTGAGVDVLSWA